MLYDIYDYEFYKLLLEDNPKFLYYNDGKLGNSIHWYLTDNIMPLWVGDKILYTYALSKKKMVGEILNINLNDQFPLVLNTKDIVHKNSIFENHVFRIFIKLQDEIIDNPFDSYGLYLENYNLDLSVKPSVYHSNPLRKFNLFDVNSDILSCFNNSFLFISSLF